MFDNGPQVAGIGECKPDPEEMLQRARKRLLKAKKDIENFRKFADGVDYLTHGAEESAIKVIGVLVMRQWQEENQVDYWLSEIDKE